MFTVLRYLPTASLLIVTTAFGLPRAASSDTIPKTRATMQSMYRTLSDVYLLSLDTREFQSQDHREDILLSLRTLAANARWLDDHGGQFDDSFDHLRRSLARDAGAAASYFENGRHLGAIFLVEKLMENCVACHARTPSDRNVDLGADLTTAASNANLPETDRIRLLVVTRQFEQALTAYERLLAERPPDEIALFDILEGYLKICVRVRGDCNRAISTLRAFGQRQDLPKHMEEDARHWIDVLGSVDVNEAGGREMERARTLIDEARRESRFPSDRRGLASFVAASALLYRDLDSNGIEPTDLAETYYLLGVAEAFISRSYWVSDTEFFLEKAIRLDPSGPVATTAYEFLEQYVASAYAGSRGGDVPPEVKEWLATLRRMIGE